MWKKSKSGAKLLDQFQCWKNCKPQTISSFLNSITAEKQTRKKTQPTDKVTLLEWGIASHGLCEVNNAEKLEPLCHCMVRNTCYLCHYQMLRRGRKRFFFFNLLQDLLLVFFWILSTMSLLIPLFFMNYIIFKISIPQNYRKYLPFQASQIHLFLQLPPLRQAAECPSSAKSKEWAKQNMAEVPRRRNAPSALRKPRTGGCSMPRWDHAERAAWRHSSRTGGTGSQAKA